MAPTLLTPPTSPLSALLYKVNEICALALECSNIEDLLEKSFKDIVDFFGAKRGSVFLFNPQTRKLILKTAIKTKIDEQKGVMEYLEQSIAADPKHQKPALVHGLQNQKPFICSPLVVKNQLIAIFCIFDKMPDKNFTQRDLQLLEFFCRQIAFNYQRISTAHELHQASVESRNLKKQMESQVRLASLGKLAGGIAHEFNNPLDGVMRYTNLCLRHAEDDEVLREYLTEIQQGLKRMANIVRNLLDCARNSPSSGHKADVHHTIEGALKEFNPYLASKNINLIMKFGQKLPEITDLGLERIVSNLVKNAIDAIDKNGTIEITTGLEEGQIKIEIYDSGRGIASQDLEKIFDPFFTTKDIDQGCGLGLTVVNEIVKHYGGKIKVKSHPGQGSTFSVRLPVK
jgi:signal transduction histidine kinase